ncbi:autotransporter domain-containing protein [Ancylobacter mangrovi]|uniref:autotransporter domain-containing protein n=1 Tax=Ancylobacter mangrovi TaxID=2972472 RepID=UPI0021616CCB|nr:autotransporter domain-containing protein [Ancylobacter mangrovi]MCS0503321.1 autotransporter domain-containing protein [Ancylobacter mangrovi]
MSLSAIGGSAAFAQASGCDVWSCNTELLSNFGTLTQSSAGKDILDKNLSTEIEIYSTSTSAQKQTAALDSQLQSPTLYYNIWNHAVPQLSYLFDAGNLLAPGTNFPDTHGAYIANTFNAVNAFVDIAGGLKNYFGNSSTLNSYGEHYKPLSIYASDAAGDPRPFVVSPEIHGNPWTPDQASPLAVTIQQSSNVPQGYQAQDWGTYIDNSAFPSGHSTMGNTLALLTGIMAPEYFKDFLRAGVEFGLSRNIFGVHYPLDVISGRILATYNIAQWLNGVNYDGVFVPDDDQKILSLQPVDLAAASASLQAYIGSGGGSPYAASCENNVIGCIRAGVIPTAAQFAQDRQDYLNLLTYNLPDLTSTTEAPVVPEGAEVLLSTRFPYLTADQRREVLRTTELPSGNVFDNGKGWARLNLYAAADGFGALNCGGEGSQGCIQTVTMNAARGGYNAFDVWANDMTGDGGLALRGSGTLVLAGNSLYTGGTTVEGGTLALTGSIVGPLSIGQAGTFYNAGTVSARGGSAVHNDGVLINDALIDSNVKSTGAFGNNGTVTGSVETGGLFFGTGTVQRDLMVSAGTIAPGNSVGTVTVGGNVTLAPGTTYQAEFAQDGTADLITAGGTVAVAGANLQLSLASPYIGLRHYEILGAAGGVNGAFAGVNDPFGTAYPLLDAVVSYTANGVALDTVRSDVPFVALANTANQTAVAAARDTMQAGSTPLDDALLSLNAGTAPAAFSSLSPEINASAKSVMITDSQFVRRAVFDRLRTVDGNGGANDIAVAPLFYGAPAPVPAASAPFPTKAAPAPAEASPGTLWASGFGNWSSMNGNGDAAGLDSTIGGFFIGADGEFQGWRLGVLGGYSSGSMDVDARASSGDSDNWHGGAYAGRKWGALALRTGLAYSWQGLETTRSLAFNGYADTLKSDYDAGTFQAFGELGYGIDTALAHFEPFANLAYVNLHTDSYGEQGGSAALVTEGSTSETGFTTLGIRTSLPLAVAGADMSFYGSVGWQHAFGDTTPTDVSYFALGGASFITSGLPIAEDAAVVEAGLRLATSERANLSVAYSGQYGDGTTQNGLNATLKVSF